MAGASVRIRINRATLKKITSSPTGPVVRHVEKIMNRTANNAKRNVRVDNGTLRSSIMPAIQIQANRVVGRCGTPLAYGWYLERGTGVYGPTGRPITPKRRKYLRFVPKGSKVAVYALSVKGVEGDRWLSRAFRDASPYPVTINY